MIFVSQQQSATDISIDTIPVDVSNTQSGEVDPAEVPEEIISLTRELASEQPPTNPLVVLKAARWWYLHGKGGNDPAFQWAMSGHVTSRPTRPAMSTNSTRSSSISLRLASLTRNTTSGDRRRELFCAPRRGAARAELKRSQ